MADLSTREQMKSYEAADALRRAVRRMIGLFTLHEQNLVQQPAAFWLALGNLEFLLSRSRESLVQAIRQRRGALQEPEHFSYHVDCREALAEVYGRLDLLADAMQETEGATPCR